MVTLNLPYYRFKIKEKDSKTYIFDELRKKYLLLTPEEWVRQHVLQYLVIQKLYPRGLIRIESGLVFNTMLKRSDILVMDKAGNPFLLVECKAPSIQLGQETMDQAARYNTTYQARFLVVTNGLELIACSIDHAARTIEVLQEIPVYQP